MTDAIGVLKHKNAIKDTLHFQTLKLTEQFTCLFYIFKQHVKGVQLTVAIAQGEDIVDFFSIVLLLWFVT